MVKTNMISVTSLYNVLFLDLPKSLPLNILIRKTQSISYYCLIVREHLDVLTVRLIIRIYLIARVLA
jgi:hypothetical protein